MIYISIALVCIAAMATYVALEVLKRQDIRDETRSALNSLQATVAAQQHDVARLNEELGKLRLQLGFNKRTPE